MSADPKVLDRLQKLLRLAAPASGTTEHERAAAALEVARLVADFDINIGEAARSHSTPTAKEVQHGVWVQSIALQPCGCTKCGGHISKADIVWVRIVNGHAEFRHNYGICKIA